MTVDLLSYPWIIAIFICALAGAILSNALPKGGVILSFFTVISAVACVICAVIFSVDGWEILIMLLVLCIILLTANKGGGK